MNVKKLFEIMSKASSITFTDYGIAADDKTYAVTIEEFSGLPKTAEKVAEPKAVEKVSDVVKDVSETVSKEIEETSKAVPNEPKKVASFMVKSDEWSEKLLLERIADFKTKFKKRAKDARVKIAYIMDKVSVLEENQKYIKDIGYKIKALKNVNLPEALDIVNDSIKSLKGEKTVQTAQSVQKTEDMSIVPYEAEARYYVRYYWLKLEDEVKSHALCAEFVNSMGLKITAKTASFYCPVIHDEDDANIVTSRLSVISWQTEHPNETVAKCSEELGLSMSLCRRWWNFNEDVIRINTTDLAGNPV